MALAKPARERVLPRLKARRQEICLTAAHTFVERGFDATSVNDIAAALGITKAGLYHYISSKESLLFDIITLGLDSIDEEVVEPTRGIADPEERLLDIVLRHALLATCNDGVITLLIDEVHALPQSQRKKINLRRRRYFEYVRGALRELQAAGRLQDIDPTVAAFSVVGAIMWLPQWFRPGGQLSSEEVAEETVQFVTAGVLRPVARRKGGRPGEKRLALSTTGDARRRLDVRAITRLDPRRIQICMTAARTFVERGYEATSVNEVAAAVGVTKAGLYHYIRSKDALLFEILTLGMDWLDEDVVKVVHRIPDPERRLRETVSRHARLTACNEPWITALLDEMHGLPPADRQKIQARKRAYFDLVRGMILDLQTKGRIRSVDATVATYAILGMIIWIPRWFRPRRRLKAEQVAAHVAAIALNGLFSRSRLHALVLGLWACAAFTPCNTPKSLKPTAQRLLRRARALERDLLDVPLRAGALDQRVVIDGVQRVDDAPGLPLTHADLNPAKQFAGRLVEAIDLASPVAAVDVLRGDLDAPRGADARKARFERHRGAVIDLNAVVAAICHVHQLSVRRDAVGRAELIGAVAMCADRLHPRAVFRELHEAGVGVAVADVDVVLSVPRHVRRPAVGADTTVRIPLGVFFAAFEEALEIVDRFRLATEVHLQGATRIHLDDHVGTFVDEPDVVVFVDADGVRE